MADDQNGRGKACLIYPVFMVLWVGIAALGGYIAGSLFAYPKAFTVGFVVGAIVGFAVLSAILNAMGVFEE